MLKIDRKAKAFTRLGAPTMAEVSISERGDLQEYISNSPEAFFEEIGQSLFLIGKEVRPSDDVEDRIDLLALDKEGQAVIIELKRGNHKLQMFQAISYAGMVATWEPDDFLGCLDADRQDKLTDFLEVETEEINRHQRIILIAEDFDYSVLVGAEWLTEHFGVNILCCRLSVAKDDAANAEFLVCSNIFPAPELLQQAVRRGRSRTGVGQPKWTDWNTALSTVTNAAVVAFYKKELAAGQENYLRKRYLQYRIANRRRWFVAARRLGAYVWQYGRFEGDVDFWRSSLSQPDDVTPVKDGQCLSFSMSTDEDFQWFHQAATAKLLDAKWAQTPNDDDSDGEAEMS
ncbi:MAG TPA: hypothetical protein VHY91_05365 [Pirellulales bacterium]|jgi:hypothetical protein|nr:hypothetical protein [Pirellulales bacterium]